MSDRTFKTTGSENYHPTDEALRCGYDAYWNVITPFSAEERERHPDIRMEFDAQDLRACRAFFDAVVAAQTCANCGRPIHEGYSGNVKLWFHDVVDKGADSFHCHDWKPGEDKRATPARQRPSVEAAVARVEAAMSNAIVGHELGIAIGELIEALKARP